MCHVSVLEFFINHTRPEEFRGKRVLEVGSRYVNGSIRPLIERFLKPREYIGIDLEPGRFVDVVLPGEKAVDYFGPESFDVVISTETLEHVRDWRAVISSMKAVLKPGGYIYITTRSFGFQFHGYPHDFWRYELEDMRRIFADFEVLVLERDREAPGVFLKARKPLEWRPVNLGEIELYSVVLQRRTRTIPDIRDMSIFRKLVLTLLNSKARWIFPTGMLSILAKKYAV